MNGNKGCTGYTGHLHKGITACAVLHKWHKRAAQAMQNICISEFTACAVYSKAAA